MGAGTVAVVELVFCLPCDGDESLQAPVVSAKTDEQVGQAGVMLASDHLSRLASATLRAPPRPSARASGYDR